MSEEEKKPLTTRIDVRATPADKAKIAANAKAAGLSTSDFLRGLGIGAEIKPPKTPEERRSLAGIANNLNQVARRVNAGHEQSQWLPMLQLMLKRLDEYFS
jgi:hypothetical protein